MKGIEFRQVDANGVRLNCAIAGNPEAPLIICLHGFPEYWAGWRSVMEELAGAFHVVAPDQRGYNLSTKPDGVDAYRARHMVADLAALVDVLSPGQPFVLAGHDWGASVAYAYAFAHPNRLTHLVIANGVHPVCFQRAILEDAGQRQASQYINRLRTEDAETLLSADGYARLLRMFEKFSAAPWIDGETKRDYVSAWSQPGALTGMLNWYRASPIAVPAPDDPAPASVPVLDLAPEAVTVRMPHLVLWGEQDTALRPSCLEGLERFAPRLSIERIPGASHWILHEKPLEVARRIRAFVSAT
jgi:pimeloyl-ACP methyl ester carboxylesterase